MAIEQINLEEIRHLAREELEKHLPRLLASPDLRLKSLGLQGLAKTDPEEAVLHLELLLLSREPSAQMVALENGVHVPFSRFQEPLLKLFVIESNLDILKTAGDFFVINPDPRIPYKLLEIAEHSQKEKLQLIQEIMMKCGKAIRDSGMLKGDFSAFWTGLTSAVAEKARQKTVRDLLVRLETEDLSENLALVERFQKSLEKDAPLKASFERLVADTSPTAGISFSETVRERLRALMKSPGADTPQHVDGTLEAQKKTPPPSIQGLFELPLTEQIKQLARLAAAKREEAEVKSAKGGDVPANRQAGVPEGLSRSGDGDALASLLLKIVEEPRSPPELLIAALQAADEMNLASLATRAQKFLSRSEEKLVVQSLMYLGRFEFEAIFPRLGAMLSSDKPYVSITVKKIINRFDPVRAIRFIQLLLQKPYQRETARQWMLMVDFSLIRDVLADFLAGDIPEVDFDKGLLIFRMNPDPGNLYSLFRLQKLVPGHRTGVVEKVLRDTLATLRELQIVSDERCTALEEEFRQRYAEEQRRQALPAPAYSVKNLEKVAKDVPREGFWDHVNGWTGRLMAAGVILCVGIGGVAWMSQPPGSIRSAAFTPNATFGPRVSPTDPRAAATGEMKAGEDSLLYQAMFDATGPEVKKFLNADYQRATFFRETSRLLKGMKK